MRVKHLVKFYPAVLALLCLLPAFEAAAAGDPLACVKATPPPRTVTLDEGYGRLEAATIHEIIPGYCMSIAFGGKWLLWTTLDQAGGVSCNGNAVLVDRAKADAVFPSYRLSKLKPAACGAPACRAGTPPALEAGAMVDIFHDKAWDMTPSPIASVGAACYEVSYGGNALWIPKSALSYRCEYLGSPLALDYAAKRKGPC